MTSVAELLKQQSQKKQEKAKLLEQERQHEEDQSNVVDVEDVRKQIREMIATNEIVVYSKSYCPYCRQAKMMLQSIPGVKDKMKVIELDDGNHTGWQTQVSEVINQTYLNCDDDDDKDGNGNGKNKRHCQHNNTKSVPQIFLHQLFIGGADDLADMYTNGSLFNLLKSNIYISKCEDLLKQHQQTKITTK